MGKKRPTHEVKLGKIRAAIWANESGEAQSVVQRHREPALQGRRRLEGHFVLWTRRSSGCQQSD